MGHGLRLLSRQLGQTQVVWGGLALSLLHFPSQIRNCPSGTCPEFRNPSSNPGSAAFQLSSLGLASLCAHGLDVCWWYTLPVCCLQGAILIVCHLNDAHGAVPHGTRIHHTKVSRWVHPAGCLAFSRSLMELASLPYAICLGFHKVEESVFTIKLTSTEIKDCIYLIRSRAFRGPCSSPSLGSSPALFESAENIIQEAR